MPLSVWPPNALRLPLTATSKHLRAVVSWVDADRVGWLQRYFEREVARLEIDFADRKRRRMPAERFVLGAYVIGIGLGLVAWLLWGLVIGVAIVMAVTLLGGTLGRQVTYRARRLAAAEDK